MRVSRAGGENENDDGIEIIIMHTYARVFLVIVESVITANEQKKKKEKDTLRCTLISFIMRARLFHVFARELVRENSTRIIHTFSPLSSRLSTRSSSSCCKLNKVCISIECSRAGARSRALEKCVSRRFKESVSNSLCTCVSSGVFLLFFLPIYIICVCGSTINDLATKYSE